MPAYISISESSACHFSWEAMRFFSSSHSSCDKLPLFTNPFTTEWTVMKIIWSEPPKTLQDILGSLKHTGWSTTTIQTYLARLAVKLQSINRSPANFLPSERERAVSRRPLLAFCCPDMVK